MIQWYFFAIVVSFCYPPLGLSWTFWNELSLDEVYGDSKDTIDCFNSDTVVPCRLNLLLRLLSLSHGTMKSSGFHRGRRFLCSICRCELPCLCASGWRISDIYTSVRSSVVFCILLVTVLEYFAENICLFSLHAWRYLVIPFTFRKSCTVLEKIWNK